MFYWKIELCIIRMGDSDLHAACKHEQEMVDHVIPEFLDNVPLDRASVKLSFDIKIECCEETIMPEVSVQLLFTTILIFCANQ